MTELFLPDGHLTDKALAALLDGSLSELQRLEAGEHLSCCDRCVDRYTALLTGDTLEPVPRDQALPVMWKVKKRRWNDTVRRYASAAAAVFIGGMLWYSGTLAAVGETLVQPPEFFQQQITTEHTLSREILDRVNDWSARVRTAAVSGTRTRNRQNQESFIQNMEDTSK